MFGTSHQPVPGRRTQWPGIRAWLWTLLGAAVVYGTAQAGDILRGGTATSSASSASTATAGSGTSTPTTTGLTSSQDRLARTTQALAAVQAMQQAARNLALAGANNLKPNLPAVPLNSYGQANGLVLAAGVPKDLLNPTASESAALWSGANLPVLTTQTTNGTETSTVTITQTQQQALLNWQSFNIGKNTTLSFDQSAGGSDVGQWIAFNKIGVTGSPSQILGAIQAQGQVYVINPNGIIFGGSSQVNTHALVASSLPINDNLVSSGLLNNPDAQFLFSALPLAAGKNGTPSFTPSVNDVVVLSGSGNSYTLALNPLTTVAPTISYTLPGASPATLAAGTDYTLNTPGTDGKMTVTFTAGGLQKIAGAAVNVAYTPLGDQYGNVEVQAGAQQTAPTTADHVGGRIALVGTNVSNAGTISTADGQTILAAGLQVGFAAHATADPTLRGLDVYVGAVVDPASNSTVSAGTATNDAVLNSDGTTYTGLISAPRGDITITGQTVNQLGFIDSSTSVAYNGRVDLVAGFNAISNPQLGTGTGSAIYTLPFLYSSNAGNALSGDPVTNTGQVTLGSNSVLRILPESSTDRITGDLALPSLVNVQGGSVYFAANSTLLAPGAAVPPSTTATTGKKPALGIDGSALQAGVSVQAGSWSYDQFGVTGYQFLHTTDAQQIYIDQGAAIDVAGLSGVTAPVTENIVSVELRGSELANSPLQRDSALRGQTIQVDVRQHGPWDPTLNGGLGGYTWVGTPLADTSGWVGLTTHSVSELSTNGGSVALSAGGAVVVQTGATVDVSGGSIAYQGGAVSTTKLVSGGHVYDISQATSDRTYDGIYNATTTTTDAKWGITTSSTNPLSTSVYENGYTQGGNGGSLAITAPALALDGTLRGVTTAGPTQRTLSPVYNPASPPDPANPTQTGVPAWLINANSMPVYGELAITVQRQIYDADPLLANFQDISPTPANIFFKAASTLSSDHPVAAFNPTGSYSFSTQRNYEVDLSPDLVSNDTVINTAAGGFGIVKIDNSGDNLGESGGYGNIAVKSGTSLVLPAGGSLNLAAGNITVESGYLNPTTKAAVNTTVSVPGGYLGLSAYDISSSSAELVNLYANASIQDLPAEDVPQYTADRGNIAVGSDAVLGAGGLLVDERLTASAPGSSPLLTAGGTIALNGSNITLAAQSTPANGNSLSASELDVSGGGTISTAGKISYANAGSITLNAGVALGSGFGTVAGGQLALTGANLQGYAGVGKSGGTLTLQAPSVGIATLTNAAVVLTDTDSGALTLDPGFFNVGGFSTFAVTGLGLAVDSTGVTTGGTPAFTVAKQTTVTPAVQNWEELPGGAVFTAQTGLQKPVNLKFKAGNQLLDVFGVPLGNDTGLILNPGAVIATAPTGNVSLTGASVEVEGTVSAPGGQIAVTATGKDVLYTGSVPTLHLSAHSVLDASGTAIYGTDVTGYHKTDVIDGGQITVDGNIVADKGALLNVSGADDTIQVAAGQQPTTLSSGANLNLISVEKQSNGGTVTLTGEKILLTNATLLGAAGTDSSGSTVARGGDLAIVSNRAASGYDDDTGTFLKPDDPVLIVATQNPVFNYSGLGQTITDQAGDPFGDVHGLGQLWFGAASLTGSGFGGINISANGRGAVQVQGAVSLSTNRQISVADGGVLAFAVDPTTPTAAPSLKITAPYVVLGQSFLGPQQPTEQSNPFGSTVSAVNGNATLTVNAGSLIDVGNLVVQNAGVVKLDATYSGQTGTTAGAIRGDGTLDLSGALTLKAGQVYPTTATTLNLIASDHTVNGTVVPGSVTIQSAGTSTAPVAPLSAAGSLNIYASSIDQGGVLRAPLGTISLGASGSAGTDPFSGAALPVTSTLILGSGSLTSVSAVTNATTGAALTIPYGINVNGDTWVDPTGQDITAPLAKAITLTATSIDLQTTGQDLSGNAEPAAKIDLSGGGDLYAYRYVPGVGGKIDVLAATAGAFAVMPGYADVYSPAAAYDSSNAAQTALGNDAGYTILGNAGFKSKLEVGDRVHLEAGGGLPAGDYTILPARYALLPGAFLITPQNTSPSSGAISSVTQPVGSTVVSGYRFNGFNPVGSVQSLFGTFEVASQTLVLQRAEYDTSLGNAFFTATAAANGTTLPRLPVDAGQLVVAAGSGLNFQGAVAAQGGTGGRGGIIDISSSADILIGSQSVISALGTGATSNQIVLDAANLSDFGAESLLIGGVRSTGATGTTVTVNTNNITVDNAGEALTGSDVILVANENLTLKDGAVIGKSGQATVASDPLTVVDSIQLAKIGDTLNLARGGTAVSLPSGTPGAGLLTATSAGTVTNADGTTTRFDATTDTTTNAFAVPAGGTITLDGAGMIALASSTDTVVKAVPVLLGDGALLRVGSDPLATITRQGVASSTTPALTVGAGVKLTGARAILDSTNVTNLDPTATLGASSVSLDSGAISVVLTQPGTVPTTGNLVLSGTALQSLQQSAALSLLSYSNLDIYGTGTLGSATLDSLALHAGAIRGFPNSSDPTAAVTVAAKTVQLDNSAGAVAPVVSGTPTGTLAVSAGTLDLGAGQMQVQNYAAVTVNATGGVLATDTGGLSVKGGDLTITAPLITAATAASQSIAADGKLSLLAATSPATVASGLGASLNLSGKSIKADTVVRLPSGTMTMEATTGDLTVTGGTLDVGGTAQTFYEVTKYTDGGSIKLMADAGDLVIGSGSKVSVSAVSAGGSAGTVTGYVPSGTLSIAAGTLSGQAGAGGQGGSFNLDTASIPGDDPAASHLSALNQTLADGGFTRSVALRVRTGDVIADGSVQAHDYALSADQGSITVTGTIDASGMSGSTRANPLAGTINAADPTGGSIDLAASGSVVLTPDAWLTAAGYAYNNAGKGGSVSLSGGGYQSTGGVGQVNAAAIVDIQPGSQIDLGVKNQFTAEDLALNTGSTPPVSTRTDLFTGTLHVRESQAAFGTGSQFNAIGSSINQASSVVLEGFQAFDLTGTNGSISTTGAITSIGSGGLINSAVKNAVNTSGTAFVANADAGLLGNSLFHVQPGAEIVNNAPVDGTITSNLFTLYSSTSSSRSLINFTLNPGSGVITTVLIPGGLPSGVTLKTTSGRKYTLTLADGTTTSLITAGTSTTISTTNSANPVVAVNFQNTGGSALATQLNFNTGSTPFTLALDPAIPITSNAFAAAYSAAAGDLTLANTWDLSAFRYGPKQEPGNLTLRTPGNLVFGFDASLSDGFDPTNAVSATYPLWTAQLQTGSSWSYRLVAGADLGAADTRQVQATGNLAANSGSVLVGQGSVALPSTANSSATRSSIVPRYYQTIRTGTGDIDISAANDVQLLNPLATIYTSGRAAPTLAGFDLPMLNVGSFGSSTASTPYYTAQYSLQGGDVDIQAQHDIARYTVDASGNLIPDSSQELPTNWLYRRSTVGADGNYAAVTLNATKSTEIQSTSWWVDFSNFFSDVGALGGGQVKLVAGNSVANVNAAVPTNARMPYQDATGATITPLASNLVELGGGNLSVTAGMNIDGGVYYVERGDATLRAGASITTNETRVVAATDETTSLVQWLPTTFFLGKGHVDITAGDDLRLGAVANPFLLPAGAGNRIYEKSFFSTFDPASSVTVSSLAGDVTLQDRPDDDTAGIEGWYQNVLYNDGRSTPAAILPWLRVVENDFSGFYTVAGLMAPTLKATAFTGDINLVGRLTLAPSPVGTLDLLAGGSINGVQPNDVSGGTVQWGSAVVNLSDADPSRLPGIITPVSFSTYNAQVTAGNTALALAPVDALFAETGSTNLTLAQKLALHGQTTDALGKRVPLHFGDPNPVHVYAAGGDVSGLTLYAGKQTRVLAANDITDIALYLQNQQAGDVSLVAAGHNIVAYDPVSPLRLAAQAIGNSLPGDESGATGSAGGAANAGDLQIAGSGTLEVLAGTNINLGSGNNPTSDGTAAGITSVGSARNSFLPQNSGSAIIAAAGVGSIYTPTAAGLALTPGLATTSLQFGSFVAQFLDPASAGAESTRYLPVLASFMGVTSTDPTTIWNDFGYQAGQPLTEHQASLVLGIFNRVLRDAARDRNDPTSPKYGTYTDGYAAIAALLPGSPQPTQADLQSTVPVVRPAGPWTGDLSLATREIKTFEGGDISLLVPGGEITVGRATDPQKPDQGILTGRGGAISIFAADSVNVGTSRIFTLRGGDEVVWSSWGNIAAGSGSKTVYSAPPTRVLVDPQSGDVQNDLAGLATGSGIGVLATLSGVKPGDVDLIAPVGTIDAGDAGIRSSGNLNVAARVVLNASNIQVGGTSTGTPPPPPAPNLGSLTAASNASAGANSSATEVASRGQESNQVAELPSLISVEVLGYGGGDDDEDDKKKPVSTNSEGGAGY